MSRHHIVVAPSGYADEDVATQDFFMHFLSRGDDNPRIVNYFRSTAWTG